MATVIIGFGTTVGGAFATACVVSAQWGISPNTQSLYCLGKMTPHKTIEKPTETVSITCYTSGVEMDVSPSTDCTTPTGTSITISPSACSGASASGVTGANWLLTSYSYSKNDPQSPGQETWSFTRWVAGTNATDSPAPSVVIRGVAEGQATVGGLAGVTFTGAVLTSKSGSVSAGQQGTADDIEMGQVSGVGGATAAGGDICSGNASIPLTPLWLGTVAEGE